MDKTGALVEIFANVELPPTRLIWNVAGLCAREIATKVGEDINIVSTKQCYLDSRKMNSEAANVRIC